MGKIIIGEKFNKLTLLKRFRVKLKNHTPTYYGLYRCDCGEEKMMLIHNVRHNNTKSCGCDYVIGNKQKNARHKVN